jgi:hypothetical protein
MVRPTASWCGAAVKEAPSAKGPVREVVGRWYLGVVVVGVVV